MFAKLQIFFKICVCLIFKAKKMTQKPGLMRGDKITVKVKTDSGTVTKQAEFRDWFPKKKAMVCLVDGEMKKVLVADAELPKEALEEKPLHEDLDNIKPVEEGFVQEKPKQEEKQEKKKIGDKSPPKVTKSERVIQLVLEGKSNEEILELVACDPSYPSWYRSLVERDLPKNEKSKKYIVMKAVLDGKSTDQIVQKTGFQKSFVKDIVWSMNYKNNG